ncbi:hypothetical protein K1F50_11925 [Muricauda oceani]|uniref:Fibronectin type-III domain-containing protein n=1 Tax=Flagellimonas oceani TaxID=2698672 RepID=A0A6G7J4I5_9FLAO|nr:hypothetical protein [Allomuricauda oceani]MBW8243512.1 hypothetical protein [Allomuricauda oceani]QII45725.1 hypothetical protein GVT53_13905 [Allomuricauda oceani]
MKTMKSIAQMICFCMTLILCSCGGGSGGEQPPPEPEPSNDLPLKVTGTLPVNGEPCSDYEEVPSDDSMVLIAFNWNEAQFADNYELAVMEGSSEVFSNMYSNLEAQVELQRGKTYTWSVTAINEFGKTPGNTYSFTTPGIPVGNYAPYAAEISVAFNTETMEMSISWVGSDEDDDALTYDIKILENENIILEETGVDANIVDPIQFIDGVDYSVEIISKDTSGNFSISTRSFKAP